MSGLRRKVEEECSQDQGSNAARMDLADAFPALRMGVWLCGVPCALRSGSLSPINRADVPGPPGLLPSWRVLPITDGRSTDSAPRRCCTTTVPEACSIVPTGPAAFRPASSPASTQAPLSWPLPDPDCPLESGTLAYCRSIDRTPKWNVTVYVTIPTPPCSLLPSPCSLSSYSLSPFESSPLPPLTPQRC